MHHVVSERGTDKARQRSDLGSTKIQSCLDGATISVVGERAQLQICFFLSKQYLGNNSINTLFDPSVGY